MKRAAISILVGTLLSPPAFAGEACTNEPNPKKTRAFTAKEWQKALDHLQTVKPPDVSGGDYVAGVLIYLENREKSAKFKRIRDKKQHCFMGCLIAGKVNYETAAYMAWLKEEKDLKDCSPNTHYDLRDIDATIKGAVYGTGTDKDTDVCFNWCDANITKADR